MARGSLQFEADACSTPSEALLTACVTNPVPCFDWRPKLLDGELRMIGYSESSLFDMNKDRGLLDSRILSHDIHRFYLTEK